MTAPKDAGGAPPLVDPHEVRRRAIWHDVRSVLAAAVTNVEYLGGAGIPQELIEVVREVEHEIRLAADVIEIVSANRDPQRKIELDLRALLWVARRANAPVSVDATTAPFAIRGQYPLLTALVDAIVAAAIPGKLVSVACAAASTCTLGNLDVERIDRAIAAARDLDLDVDVDRERGTLVLRRS